MAEEDNKQDGPQPGAPEADTADERNLDFVEQMMDEDPSGKDQRSGETDRDQQADEGSGPDSADEEQADDQSEIDALLRSRRQESAPEASRSAQGGEDGRTEHVAPPADSGEQAEQEQQAESPEGQEDSRGDPLGQDAIRDMLASREESAGPGTPAGEEDSAGTPEAAGPGPTGEEGKGAGALGAGGGVSGALVEEEPPGPRRRISPVQIVLLLNTGLILLFVAVLMLSLRSTPRPAQGRVEQRGPGPEQPPASRWGEDPTRLLPVERRSVTSWPEAERAYAEAEYDLALRRYMQLLKVSRTLRKNAEVRDFLRLRIAQCLRRSDDMDKARDLLGRVVDSQSPVVSAVARYEMGRLLCSEAQYLRARSWAYRAIAVCDALPESVTVQTHSAFLIARALSERSLSFFDPEDRLTWIEQEPADPFKGLSEAEVRRLLTEGAEALAAADWGPTVERIGGDRLRVMCLKVPLIDALECFSAQTGIDVVWATTVSRRTRHRPVSVYFPRVSPQKLSETLCGIAGLISRFTGQKVYVHDPSSYTSMAAQRDLFIREAISVWRVLLLRATEDPRRPYGHLALARLYEGSGEPDDALVAMREYRLIASGYASHDVAPEALLRSAKLRMKLRDYQGALSDLNDLLDGYPRFQADELYLRIAAARLRTGEPEKAAELFRRLYHKNLSLESRAAACLGAGRALFRSGQLQRATKWLKRYVGLTKGKKGSDLAEALELLAQMELQRDRPVEAIQCVYRALAERPSARRRATLALTMARAQLHRDNHVRALGAMEKMGSGPLDEAQTLERLVLMGRIYRGMGLPSEAVHRLSAGIEKLSKPRARARAKLALARSLAEADRPAEAMEVYADALDKLDAESHAPQAACELAELCLESGKVDRALALLTQVGRGEIRGDARDRLNRILARCYVLKHRYDRAADALEAVRSDGGGGPVQ